MKSIFSRWYDSRSHTDEPDAPRISARPRLEALEDRSQPNASIVFGGAEKQTTAPQLARGA